MPHGDQNPAQLRATVLTVHPSQFKMEDSLNGAPGGNEHPRAGQGERQ